MNSFKKIGLAAIGSLAVGLAGGIAPTGAQQAPTPEEQAQNAVETRQAVYKLLGWNMGPMGGMLRNKVPFDAALVEQNAHRIASLAGMIPSLFEMDTREFDVETEALPRIWEGKDAFDGKAKDLVAAAEALATTAAGGDEGATRAAIAKVGQACGSCHDDYRLED